MNTSIVSDVTCAMRYVRCGGTPGFTAIASLTLALGIGGNVAIFSFVNAALFKPPFGANPDQLVEIVAANRNSGHSSRTISDFRRESGDVLSGLTAFLTYPSNLVGVEQTERINVGLISDNYFDVFGVKLLAGRDFRPDENVTPGGHFVAIISERLWRRQYGAATDLAGKVALLNGAAYTVVGVVPDRASRMVTVVRNDVFVPAVMQGPIRGGRDWLSVRGNREFLIVGRLRKDVPIARAQAKFAVIAAHLQREYPEAWISRGQPIPLTVVPHSPVTFELRGAVMSISGLLMAMVATVLLIACFNLLNFFLVRAMTRRREMAIRLALGASRSDLVQQLLTEALVLAAIGATLGLIVAYAANYALVAFTPSFGVPLEFDMSADRRVFGFCLALVALTTIVCGLLPALRVSKPEPGPTLKEGDVALSAGPKRSRLRSSLLVAQVAASLVLLLCSGLFLRSLQKLYSIDPGFDPRNVALLSVDLGGGGYTADQRRAFTGRALSRLQSLPGVESVTLAARVPMGQNRGRVELQNVAAAAPAGDRFFAGFNHVSPPYFSTMRIPIERGRAFTAEESKGPAPVVIVNEKLARDLWPNQSALGQQLETVSGLRVEVVGVAKTSTYDQIGEQPFRFAYFPLDEDSLRVVTFHVRTHTRPGELLGALRQDILDIDPRMAVFDVQTMEQHMADSLLPVRLGAILLSIFGGIGLGLAAIGLYGVMAYVVSHRTKEIGIRLALGAKPGTVVMAVLRQGMTLTAVGIAIGILIGSGITTVVAVELYGLTPADVSTLGAIVLGQAAVALLACWVPARRATRISPLLALRHE